MKRRKWQKCWQRMLNNQKNSFSPTSSALQRRKTPLSVFEPFLGSTAAWELEAPPPKNPTMSSWRSMWANKNQHQLECGLAHENTKKGTVRPWQDCVRHVVASSSLSGVKKVHVARFCANNVPRHHRLSCLFEEIHLVTCHLGLCASWSCRFLGGQVEVEIELLS